MSNRRTTRRLTLLTAVFPFFSSCMLSSCSEETEKDFTSGESTLQITVCNETQDAATRAAYDGLMTTFEEGDAIGVYAVNGSIAVCSNVKYTLTNGKWVASEKCLYDGQYTYYAYYPYTDTPATPTFSGTDDEDSKFAAIINGWMVASDQGTLEKFRANDLMIATGMYTFGRTVNFAMKHKMALAVLDSDVATFSYDTDPDTRYDVAMTYGGMIPYFDGTGYYLFMRPDMLTTIGGQQMKAGGGRYTMGNGGILTEDYTLSYSTDGGNTFSETRPSWLQDIQKMEGTKDIPTNFVVTVSDEKTTDDVISRKNKNMTKEYVAEELRNAETVADRDLSLYKNDGTLRGSRTTANCYLIHNPGTYRIPLVYGNAIKEGTENTLAYHAMVTGDNIKTDLVRHDEQPIVAPWIKDNGITVDGAELIWQDVQGLITEVGIDGDYLTFTVPEENINAGNALIAAKTGETIVWSWHIWATEETLDDLTDIDTGSHTNLDGEPTPYRVAPVNVGQVPIFGEEIGQEIVYAGSSCMVRITVSNGTTMTFSVTQPDHTETVLPELPLYSRSPYYQWGRKDPMTPGLQRRTGYNNYATWDIGGSLLTSESSGNCYSHDSGGNTIGETIRHPITFYNNSNSGPYNENNYNYWNMNQKDPSSPPNYTATNKTVYDPCPPDFCVPTSDLINYMSNNGSQTSFSSYTRARWDNNSRTMIWQDKGADLVFPSSNMRNSTSSVSGTFARGYYWSATPYNSKRARGFFFNDSYCGFGIFEHYRSYAYSIRPVAED